MPMQHQGPVVDLGRASRRFKVNDSETSPPAERGQPGAFNLYEEAHTGAVVQRRDEGNSELPLQKKLQQLAKNRVTAARSRERKAAHLASLQQKIHFLQEANSATLGKIEACDKEIIYLQGCLAGEVQGKPEDTLRHNAEPHSGSSSQSCVTLTKASAVRIYCSVVNSPSSSYLQQPNLQSSNEPAAQDLSSKGRQSSHTQQQLSGSTPEVSMSPELAFAPVCIKPDIAEPASKRVKHTVTTCNPYARLPVYNSQHQQVDSTSTCQHQEASAKHVALPGVDMHADSGLSTCFAQNGQSWLNGDKQPIDFLDQHNSQGTAGNITSSHTSAAGCFAAGACEEAALPYASNETDIYHHAFPALQQTFTEQELMTWKLLPDPFEHTLIKQEPSIDESSSMECCDSRSKFCYAILNSVADRPRANCSDSQERCHEQESCIATHPDAAWLDADFGVHHGMPMSDGPMTQAGCAIVDNLEGSHKLNELFPDLLFGM